MTKVNETIASNMTNYLTNYKAWAPVMYNVEVYGIVGDGVKDNTSAVQNLVNLAISENRKAIFFQPGIYIINDLVNSDKVVLFGDNATVVGSFPGKIYQIGVWANNADVQHLEAQIGLKADIIEVNKKASKDYVNEQLAEKAPQSALDVTNANLTNGLAGKRSLSSKITTHDIDKSSDANKIQLPDLSEGVQAAMAGTAPVIGNVTDGSLTTKKYADESVTELKLDEKLKQATGRIPRNMLQCDQIASPTTLPRKYITFPDFVFTKGSYVKEVVLFSGVSEVIDIYIAHGPGLTLTMDRKITHTVVPGYNTVPVHYLLTRDSYIGFNGGSSYKQEPNNWYQNYYQKESLSDLVIGVETGFALTDTLDMTFNMEVILGDLVEQSVYDSEIGVINTELLRLPHEIFDCGTEGSSMGAVQYTIPNFVIPANTLIKKVKTHAHVSSEIEICIFTKDSGNGFTLTHKIISQVTKGINFIPINYVLPTDSFVGFNVKKLGGISFIVGSYGDDYTSYYEVSASNLPVNSHTTFSLTDTLAVNFNFQLFVGDIVDVEYLKELIGPVQSKKYACFGDSITSDEVTGIGTTVCKKLGAEMIGNFAHGWATASDWFNGSTNETIITFDTSDLGLNVNDNVLSNQVRCMLRHTTPLNTQVTWSHPLDGSFSIDTSLGLGLGNITDIPEIIYIAIGTNDGQLQSGYDVPPTFVVDDTDNVFAQSYSQLTRKGLASALRWALETLQSAYPKANIFVASPLQTSSLNVNLTYSAQVLKRNIIEKVCKFASVHFVDSFSETGLSRLTAGALTLEGLHPNAAGKEWVGNYVSKEINSRFISR